MRTIRRRIAYFLSLLAQKIYSPKMFMEDMENKLDDFMASNIMKQWLAEHMERRKQHKEKYETN